MLISVVTELWRLGDSLVDLLMRALTMLDHLVTLSRRISC